MAQSGISFLISMAKIDAAHPRHNNVGKQQIGRNDSRDFEGAESVVCRHGSNSMLRKNDCESIGNDHFIIDHQNDGISWTLLFGNALREQFREWDYSEIFRSTHPVPPGEITIAGLNHVFHNQLQMTDLTVA